MIKHFVSSLFVLCFAAALFAQEAAPEKKSKDDSKEAKDNIVTTSHTITIGGELIKYTARAGTMIMKDEDGKPMASIFFVAPFSKPRR